MSETLLSSRNLAFELYEVLDAEGLTQRERFAEHTRETFDAAIGTARTIARVTRMSRAMRTVRRF
jgi:butyryl-CoA dehydrogenase